MPVCALIVAHHQPALLGRLVHRLSRIGIRSYIHIDARVEQEPFEQACRGGDYCFITTRYPIHWGGFSLVKALLSLVRAALENSTLSHFLHISGDTYPIKPDHELLATLKQDADLISIYESGPQTSVYQRIDRTYLPDSRLGFLRVHAHHEDRFLTPELMSQWEEISQVHALKSAKPFPWRFATGPNWWCLRRPVLERCLRITDTNPDVVLWFKYSSNPDESLFHTIILNGGRLDQCKPGPVYAEWSLNPQPYTFKHQDDMALLSISELPFARKFVGESSELLDLIDRLHSS